MDFSKQKKTQLLNAFLQVCFSVLSFVILYFSYALFNIGLQHLSRTVITTTFTFFIAFPLFTSVYGPFKIGPMRKRLLVANSACTVLFCDLMTFLQLQIMNTNPQNEEANSRFVLFDQNLPLTLVAFLLQCGLIILLVLIGYRAYRKINPPARALIICENQQGAEHVARKVAGYPYDFVLTEAVSYLCPDLEKTILSNEMIFLTRLPADETRKIKRFCYDHDKRLYQEAGLEEVITNAAGEEVLVDTAFLSLGQRHPSVVQLAVKRGFDVICSAALLILLSPLLLATSVILAASHNGSVIFRQERRTLNGRVFRIMKFRTMYEGTAANVSMKREDDRITPVGRFLRRYRIDELPQLVNILRGDMSLVGPRPEMLSNVEKYLQQVPEFRYREQMKAGITGLAQLDGLYNTLPQDKAILDLMYIEHFSLGLDMKLLLRTFTVFFFLEKEGFSNEKKVSPPVRTKARS